MSKVAEKLTERPVQQPNALARYRDLDRPLHELAAEAFQRKWPC